MKNAYGSPLIPEHFHLQNDIEFQNILYLIS